MIAARTVEERAAMVAADARRIAAYLAAQVAAARGTGS